jgi:IMP dehydrogenase
MDNIKFRDLRRAYGFDEVAIVPGGITANPDQTILGYKIGDIDFSIPIIAAAMDGVSDVDTAILMSKAGGLGVVNLDGVQTRYDDYKSVLERIVTAPDKEITTLLQKIYSEPVKEKLVAKRVEDIKKAGAICAVSVTPQNTKKLAPVVVEAGADILVVQSTVTSARHISKSERGLVLHELCEQVPIPVVVGNCVSPTACLEIMREGVAGVLVGVGPGAACTSRQVLGVGVPQITATMDCAAARDYYFKESGRYVPIITDGGMSNGGDLCKAITAGSDAVMIGSVFARATESPGQGNHWGMSHPHPALPRGTRIKVGITGSLEQILFGPTSVTDGSQNLVGALRTCMGTCGSLTVKEQHQVEMVIAPSIITEGKAWQIAAGRGC